MSSLPRVIAMRNEEAISERYRAKRKVLNFHDFSVQCRDCFPETSSGQAVPPNDDFVYVTVYKPHRNDALVLCCCI